MDDHPIVPVYPASSSYPSHATEPSALDLPPTPTAFAHPATEPAGPAPSPTSGVEDGANPFGAERRGLRKRIGSALAAIAAVAAKFGTALKALLIALPNLKLVTTAGTALVSV